MMSITITTTTVPAARNGTIYSAPIITTGGTGPYVISIPTGGGSLPAGISVATAALTGTAALTAATSTFTIRSTDSTDAYVDKTFTITVIPRVPGPFIGIYNYIKADTALQAMMGGTVALYRMPVRQNTAVPFIAWSPLTARTNVDVTEWRGMQFQMLVVAANATEVDAISDALLDRLDRDALKVSTTSYTSGLISDTDYWIGKIAVAYGGDVYQLDEHQWAQEFVFNVQYLEK